MHKITGIIFFLFTSLCAFAQTDSITINPLVFSDEYVNVYNGNQNAKLKNGVPYTGKDTSYQLLDGEKSLVIQTYKDGYKIELSTFFANGQPECFYQFSNGEPEGIRRRWYKSGNIMFDYEIKDGKEVGAVVLYYDNGNVRSVTDQKRGISVYFYETGKVHSKEKYIYDRARCPGAIPGAAYETTRWRENGQLYLKEVVNCGPRPFTYYHNDSVRDVEGTYAGTFSSMFVGKFTRWYENGQIKLDAYYSDSIPNLKVGVWKYYTEDGKLMKEEFYDNKGELKNEKTYIKSLKKIKD